jgi:CBS domain-containing protein
MLAKDLLSEILPAVSGSDTVSSVLRLMKELRVAHLPVLDQKEYLGLISEKVLSESEDPGQQTGAMADRYLSIFAIENQHVYEVIDLVSRYELTLLPVLSAEKEYRGCITLPSLVRNFNVLTAAGQPGAILVLTMAMQDYSPTLLSRIIEDNNAKIISLYAIPEPNGRDLTVTLKVNTQETSSIMRSFDRYGYKVKSHFLANSQLDDFYRSRYEELMKYMNI